MRRLAFLWLTLLTACAPITPVIPSGAWPRVAQLQAALRKPPPECGGDERARYSLINSDCLERLSAWRDRRAKLRAELDYLTGPDYVQPPP